MEQIKYKDFTIDIKDDPDCESPNEWGDTEAFLVYIHDQFTVTRTGFDAKTIYHKIVENLKSGMGEEDGFMYEGHHVFTLYAYIHSGILLSLIRDHSYWDASNTGYILVRSKEYKTREQAIKRAEDNVILWNDYLSGCCGYIVLDPSGEEGDSCWGFMGYNHERSGLLDSAKEAIDYEILNRLHSKEEEIKQQALMLRNNKKDYMEYFDYYIEKHSKL